MKTVMKDFACRVIYVTSQHDRAQTGTARQPDGLAVVLHRRVQRYRLSNLGRHGIRRDLYLCLQARAIAAVGSRNLALRKKEAALVLHVSGGGFRIAPCSGSAFEKFLKFVEGQMESRH